MICDACGHENRTGAKFCGSCGLPFSRTCPACGTAITSNDRFCTECGTALTSGLDDRPAAVDVSGEKKQITVLFADVAGSMDLQERLDAEVWAQIMGRFVSILAEGVRRFGGTVDKFTGDGIMALFGAPIAQEDHARRACHAAWHLTKSIREYSDELRRTHGVELNVRLGLNSGEVVVGRVGDDVTLDPTALGHTVGLAQRMEAMAEPGTACLTDHTARQVEGWFRLDDIGPTTVKGSREPIGVSVLGPPVSAPVRRTLGAPLVGRERELAVLEDALAAAMEGQAQVVGVVGEAGVGKSRLCEEFAASAVARGVIVRRTAGISHAKDVPLLPVLSLYREYFGINDGDRPEEAREKISKGVLALDPELHASLPLLFDFLEVPDPDRPAPQLAPDVRMRQLFAAIRRITARRSEREVLLLVAEDLQWFDLQSEGFLERLIDSFPGSRTLVVANFRPEFSASWMRHSYYRQLPLAPLREQAVSELLGGLLGVDVSLSPLVSFVLERTAGNPFFIEEVVRSLVEDGTLAGEAGRFRLTCSLHQVDVPPRVQAVLAARIDRLPEREKHLLQTAAVLGRTFSQPLLQRVVGLAEDELDAALSDLCAAEFIHEESGYPLYRFWHPLTQDVAYHGLLTEHRARLHAAAARAIVELESERLDEQAALVAAHWERAGERLEAASWNARAGRHAVRSDVTEAMRRWQSSIALLNDVPENEEALRLGVAVRTRLLQFGSRKGLSGDEAERLFHEGRKLAQRLDDPGQVVGITQFYGTVVLARGEVDQAVKWYLQAAKLADRTADTERQACAWMSPPAFMAYTGPLPAALRLAEKVIELCGDNPEFGTDYAGYSPLLISIRTRGEILSLAGRLREAHDEVTRALAISRERVDAERVAWTLNTGIRLSYFSGNDGGSVDAGQEAVHLTADSGNVMFHIAALGALGTAQLAQGQPARAVATLTEALEEARFIPCGHFDGPRILSHLARAQLAGGDADAAVDLVDEALVMARRQGARVPECEALITRAHIRRQRQDRFDRQSIHNDLGAALARSKETGARTYEPFIHEELGRLHNDEKELSEALRLYRQIGATGHADRLEAERSTRLAR